MTKEKLLKFNEEIKELYENKLCKPSPIHLSGDNAEQLIKIFEEEKITKEDWIFSTWRSHFHWLLSGRDPEELKKQIIEGHSMHIYGDKFFTSAIVAGISPIALGVALALKIKNSKERVFCFVGCAASMCGITIESINYAQGHDLPIKFIIEWNDKCVNASTSQIWGTKNINKVIKYDYKREYPHAGIGKYVMF